MHRRRRPTVHVRPGLAQGSRRRERRSPRRAPEGSGCHHRWQTNVAQLLAYIESDNPVYGRTSNPWNPERACGGSSGGEGSIIAAGGSPLGLGTDIAAAPLSGRVLRHREHETDRGRCRRSGRIQLPRRAARDRQPGRRSRAPRRRRRAGPRRHQWRPRTRRLARVDVASLRIGYYVEDGIFRSSPAIRRSVREAAQALKSAGAQVVEWQPHDTARALRLFYGLLAVTDCAACA